MTNVDIRAHIDACLQELRRDGIAEAEEILRYLTAVMRGECSGLAERPVETRYRLKAAELLAKRYGLLSDHVNLSGGVPVQIVDDIAQL